MLRHLLTIDKPARTPARAAVFHLHHQRVPAGLAAEDFGGLVVRLPGLDAHRLPGDRVQPRLLAAPAAIGEVLPVDLAELGIEVMPQRACGIESLDHGVATGAAGRLVAEAHARGVGAVECLALVADLRLHRAGGRAVGARRQAQHPVAAQGGVVGDLHRVAAPRGAGHAGVAWRFAQLPAAGAQGVDAAVAEVVEEQGRVDGGHGGPAPDPGHGHGHGHDQANRRCASRTQRSLTHAHCVLVTFSRWRG